MRMSTLAGRTLTTLAATAAVLFSDPFAPHEREPTEPLDQSSTSAAASGPE
ncbi:hypothetical protein ACQPYA_19660 [Micromonospora sp. CA-263727]|uniref:hypothetical protein n=1 Tax=Micromonospora sp. CA-263727 TaxID=3239967 RepID=UPI003D9436BC